MQINSKEILFGQPILKIREVVRHAMRQRLWGSSKSEVICKVAGILKEPNPFAKEVVKQMIQEEYLFIKKVKYGVSYQYELKETIKGRRLGITKANPPISREKATQLLNELINRAKAINANNELVYFVDSLKVFGSYLSDKEVLGDLDVGIKLKRKYDDDQFAQKSEQRSDLAIENGRRFSNWTDKLFWSETEVLLMLKARQRGLGLHKLDEDRVFEIPELKTKLVYHYLGEIQNNTL